MKNLLFITHETSRTGAPLVLLYFLQWLKLHHPQINISVLAIKEGILKEDFIKVADEFWLLPLKTQPELSFVKELKKRILKKTGFLKYNSHPQDEFLSKISKQNFDLIYANTVVSLPIAIKIKCLIKGVKLVAHIHELPTIIFLNLPNPTSEFSQIDSFVAVSKQVKSKLEEIFFVPPNKINIVYEFSRIKELPSPNSDKKLIVGGAGTVNWRKGSDIFLQVARYINTHFPNLPIEFLWIGSASRLESIVMDADIMKIGLKEKITFVGETDKPEEYFSSFDIFLMPSREDPFPLVAIEVGKLGKPIICFEKATGTAEILDSGGGFVAPYLNIEMIAEKIIFYFYNRKEMMEDGDKARELFSEFTPEKMCPQLFAILKSI